MDLEAMQLLNLSPIPELSELELSTMLEQLSGLSDINGELTDRNVEDIIKEAEDLLDKSKCSDINISNNIINPAPKEVIINDVNDVPELHQADINEHKSSLKTNSPVSQGSLNEAESADKYSNSPTDATPTKLVLSPAASCNHIKSTIDSLKEFSTLVEKKLSNSPLPSPTKQTKATKEVEKALQNNVSSQESDKIITIKEPVKGKPVKPQDIPKGSLPDSFDKSVKLLNCFERLYQDRPIRWMPCKKPKVADKIPKALSKRKLTKDFKNVKKNSRQGKCLKRDSLGEPTGSAECVKDYFQPETAVIEDDPVKESKEKFFVANNTMEQNKMPAGKESPVIPFDCLKRSPVKQCQDDGLRKTSSTVDEKLIFKVLEEMEKLKDQVRKAGIINDTQNKGLIRGNQKPEVRSDSLDLMKKRDLRRLEEQVWILKEKYDHQLEKLETENFRLREALSSKFLPPPIVYCETTNGHSTDRKSVKTSTSSPSPKKEKPDSKISKNSPSLSPGDIRTLSKEAFSQTEADMKGTCSQCSQDIKPRDPVENRETETKETENKENVVIKKKSGKWKPFSDINVHHLMKQKRVFDHETQLLATVRGLQAELSTKEKESRKLRSEVDSLRRQLNKWTNLKVDICRKSHMGTQTIGLGPIVQRPYNPENFEAAEDELQRENEELRLRIKGMKEDFEILKEKRISDLHSLHKVHEEEMAKVVSKLETQSALTKHLHSLLINR